MAKSDNNTNYYTIDLLHILNTIWSRLWIIVLSGILAGAIGFSVATFFIAPKYSSSIMLYVNNSSVSIGSANFSITSSEITAAQSLVKTYTVMLNNRTTLDEVIDKTGVDYSWRELREMITAKSVDDTEVLKVTVTCKDPYEAKKIANCIAKVLPKRISEIIEGSSMQVVDSAVVNKTKVAPSITRYTAIGLIFGLLISLIIVVIMAMLDDTIHDEEYILQNYKYPILAKIPDLSEHSSRDYSYYSKKK